MKDLKVENNENSESDDINITNQPGYSLGTTLLESQNIFERYGAYNAANLDGDSSATMYYDGKLVNKPSTPMGERYLPNAIIVGK